ncbi:hypothetical protein [Tomitella biformata]|uniref:hypothetical protein n=1 Tax=Tomitella biformata TaxID=630403 RepID=UPI0004BAD6AE|nr:hypothetical protein [Tomitella biformata]
MDPAIHSAAFGLEYGREPPRPHLVSALDRLSARILALDLSDLDDHRILAALGQAVDSARYWQPPEEADVLAEHPVIRSALEPLSERLASDPSTQWFWEPRRAEQWAIDWRSENARPPLPKDPQHTLAKWVRDARVEEESAVRGRPGGPHASWTGHWWSIPLGLVQTVGHLPAALGLVEDSLGWEQATAIPVRGSGRTFEVRSEADWVYLCRDFPLEVTASRRHDWFRTTGRDGRWVIPDWARVAHEWDAVHLTVMAYLSSATRALQIDADTSSVIAGWDPGSTIWLTDAVAESDGPRQDWRLDGADDTWIRES